MKLSNLLSAVCIFIIISSCNKESKNKPANETALIYYGCDILTMDGDKEKYAEALVVKDGKILYVGDKEEAVKSAGENPNLIDLKGSTMVPGFLDPHSHYINSLSVANQCQLYAPPSEQKNYRMKTRYCNYHEGLDSELIS